MKKNDSVEKVEQLDLGFKEPLQNKFWGFKSSLAKRLRFVETIRYIRSPAVLILIGISISLNYLLFDYISTGISELPKQVPFLLNYINLDMRLVNREDLELVWIVSGILTFVSIFTTAKIYNRKQYMSYFILIVLTFSLSTTLYKILLLLTEYI